MSLRRQLNSAGIAHSNADSKLHDDHVKQRKQAREISWIPEPAPENPAEEFKLQVGDMPLGKGFYFTGIGNSETPVDGATFEKHLSAINWERRWNYASMKRGEKVSMVRRKRTSPACGEFVVNLSPWEMTFLNGELKRWEVAGLSPEKRKEMLEAFLTPLRKTVVEEFYKYTDWEVVGSYLHLDSNKIHVGVIHSRVNAENKLTGSPYLKTIGPWSCAQNRISEVGASDPADTRLKQNLERFSSRHGKDVQPLDMKLHGQLDREFEKLVKVMDEDAGKRYEAAKEHYREWKKKARRDAVTRSPSSQKIAMGVLRHLLPLLPPQVRAAVLISRTALQAFGVVNAALDAINHPPQTQQPTNEIHKIL